MNPPKSCGDCSLCCKLLGVADLDKAAGHWCAHFRKGRGCGIYAERPAACMSFQCLWTGSERLDEGWRPDRSKFVMFTEQDGRRLSVVVDPAYPDAWRREPFYSRIKAMSQRAEEGYELLVSIGDRRIVVFPDQEADLGIINTDHKIVSGYAMRDGERIPFAIVASDLEDAAP